MNHNVWYAIKQRNKPFSLSFPLSLSLSLSLRSYQPSLLLKSPDATQCP